MSGSTRWASRIGVRLPEAHFTSTPIRKDDPVQQSKLDNIVNLQLHEINKRGRGFVLDIAASSREKLESVRQFLLAQEGLLDDGAKIDRKELLDRIAEAIDAVGQTSIEVREALKPVDEYVKPADGRGHVIGDTDSFIDYAKKYGDAEKSLIFYNHVLNTTSKNKSITVHASCQTYGTIKDALNEA